jgi:cyclophilin family peptidyl-prolyl cis-trans isomerase
VAAVVVLLTGGFLLFSGGGSSQASPSPSVSPSATPSASPSPQGKPGTQTGTVDPQPAPTAVACGAQAPQGAGKPKPQFAGPPPMKIDTSKTYVATMETSCGTIVIELDAKTAPQTVNSFVFLANHHFFDGQYFTRIDTSIDVLQGGDPTASEAVVPVPIPDELRAVSSTRRGCSPWPTGDPTPAAASSSSSRARTATARRQPELHDLQQHHRRPQGRAVDPTAAARSRTHIRRLAKDIPVRGPSS